MTTLGVAAIAMVSSATTVFASHTFTDVPTTNPFHDDIQWLADNEITEGFADGGFHPNAPVSRQAMAAFMHRLSGQGDVAPTVNAFELGGRTRDQIEPMWVSVNADGTTAHSSGDVAEVINLVGNGNWAVRFDRDVSGCAYSATLRAEPGEIHAEPRLTDAVGVFVGTHNSAGAFADRAFYLVVVC